jgi:hypothetical protein
MPFYSISLMNFKFFAKVRYFLMRFEAVSGIKMEQ